MLNALTTLSLLLCMAMVALWVRSYWKADGIERARGWETTTAAGPFVRWRTAQLSSNRRGIILASFWGFRHQCESLFRRIAGWFASPDVASHAF